MNYAAHSDKIIQDCEFHDGFLYLLKRLSDYISANFGVRISGSRRQHPITVEVDFGSLRRFSDDTSILACIKSFFGYHTSDSKKTKSDPVSCSSKQFIVQEFGGATKPNVLRAYISEMNKDTLL